MGNSDRADAGRVLLGAALRARRMQTGWTLAEAADRAGLSLSYLSEVERGRKLISLDALDAYAQSFGLTVVDLLAAVYPYGAHDRPRAVEQAPDSRYRVVPQHEPGPWR